MAQSEQTRQQVDTVVVDSGVTRTLVVYELAHAGKLVLMLEAGPHLPRWEIVERFRNQADKTDFMVPCPSTPQTPHLEYGPLNNYLVLKGEHQFNSQYIRAVGGTMRHWAVSMWYFFPNDPKLRSVYDIARDWPIQYQDLEHYHSLVEKTLGVWGSNDESLGSPRSQPYPVTPLLFSSSKHTIRDAFNAHDASFHMVTEPVAYNGCPYDGYPTYCGNNNCIPICPIGAMYNGIVHVEKTKQAGARLIENAMVFKLEVGLNRRTVTARYKDSKGAEHRMESKWFVLAASGIKTPKLTLVSTNQDFPRGMGNSSDMVEHNLIDHPSIGMGFHIDRKLWPGRGPQEVTPLIDLRNGPSRVAWVGKGLHLLSTSHIEQETQRISKEGRLIKPADPDVHIRGQAVHCVQLDSFHETLPLPENHITPSAAEMDAIGIPRPEITYHIGGCVEHSAAYTWGVCTTAAQVMGGANIGFHDGFVPSSHITDATIAGADPKDSVINRDCRTFDHPNLFVGSSSAILTVGAVNMTLTIAVLTLRVADQLKKEA